MSPRSRFCGPAGQGGAIGLIAALTLALALLFMLLVIDTGRLYLEQRKLQRVVDMAALEAVTRGGNCLPGTSAAAYAVQSATRNGFTPNVDRTLTTHCGTLATGADHVRSFTADASKSEAIRVVAQHTVLRSVAAGVGALFSSDGVELHTVLSATAVAAPPSPLAMLTIRSTLGVIDSSKSALLNALIGGMLGGQLTLMAGGWDGLANTTISLLGYLDQLAIDLHVQAGDYETLLNTTVTPTQLIDAAVQILSKGGAAASGTVQVLQSVSAISSKVQSLKLGDLISVQAGTSAAGLDSSLQLFELVQAIAQLANSQSAAAVSSQLSVPLIGNVGVQLKVIEPARLSAIGNPALAKAGLATGKDQIFVRTAQVRALITIELPVLKAIPQLTSALPDLLTPVSGVVNSLLSLDLVGVLSSALCLVLAPCDHTALTIDHNLDISLEAASAKSYVTDYSCASEASKSLTVQATTSMVNLGIGKIDPAQAFSSAAAIVVQPVRLIDIGVQTCWGIFGCGPITPGAGGGLNLMAQTSIGQRNQSLIYPLPPNIGLPAQYQHIATTNIVTGLAGTLSGLQVTSYAPPSGNVTGSALAQVAGLLSQISGILVHAIQGFLGPLLDPVVNSLLTALGISLGNAEVGANLSCHAGGRAQLVI
ncbi:hypothetical protein C1886_10200 [Pseudomonas sp. FW300-N1A1]|uniref:pilus assembly protein TadG-related protein n=1 Tax=Pseudomonas sp. FW300-N1A1 TaxID=2075555 RepID=UPI000CD20464|nr:pilus assembly protein TadG-related protein [Pseudomonas sp. FW300-N1A1]POA20043.1 hypothetical protein C1886_10200 [Pseudomonas sp. FW300-N1A1]